MSKQVPWMKSLSAKLSGITLALLAVTLLLVVANIYSLASIKGDAASMNLAGRTRMRAYHVLYLAHRLAGETGDARTTTAAEIRDDMHGAEQRFGKLRVGDPASGVPATSDPNILAWLQHRESSWASGPKPALERLLAAGPTEERRLALAALDGIVETDLLEVEKTVQLYQENSESKVERFQLTQYVFIAFVLLVLGFVFRVARGIAGRARSLATTAGRIAGGELALEAPVSGSDELAVLGGAFNAMTAHLRTTIETEKELAEILRRSQEELATTLGSIGDAVIATDLAGSVVRMNPTAEQLTGWSAVEAVGRSLEDVFCILNEETRASVESPVPRVLRDGVVVGLANHTVLVARDGTERPIADSGAPIRDAQGEIHGVVLVFRDMMEERRAEQELRRSEELYRSLFDNMLNGFAHCKMHFDDRSRPVDFTYLSVNAAFETLTGLQNVVGKKVSEVIPGIQEADPKLFEIYGRVSQTGQPERFEMNVAALDMWFSVSVYSPKKEHFVAVFDVITEKKIAEKALREREELFRGLLEAAPDAMVIVDARGLIKLLNAQTEHLFGYSRADLVGKPVEVLIPDRFRARHPEHVKGFLGSPHARPMGGGMDLFGRRRDGTEFPVEVALSPMSSADGTLVTAAIRDLTDRKQAEEVRAKNRELEMENRRVQEASRLKSEFLAHMSHELRTPLNAILGFGEILYDGQVEPGSPQSKEFLGDILTSGRHLLQLINDVLDLSKVEAGRMEFRPETIDVRTVIGEVCGIVRTGAAEKRIRVEVEVASELDATLDPARFKQVLYNYLSNALKFTPEGGRVLIRARPEGTDRLRLEVQDSGAGIAPGEVTSLFMEFVQLDPRAARKLGGTGLGLALTKRLVEAQGGSVGVTSELGKGSLFFAVLPRHAVAHPAPENTVFPAPLAGARTVLVVEDDPRESALLVEMLTGAGYAVETAATGKDALAKAGARAFDAITLDLLLPDMSGLDVLAGIRTGGSSSEAVVVIVTVVAEARAAGGFVVHDVLGKPFEPDALLASLKRGIGGESRDSVLVVDDDPGTVKLLAHTVERLGFETICHTNAKAGLEAAERAHPIAVILDLLMPEMDGFEFLDRLRALPAHRATPVIVWTAKDLTVEEHARLGAAAQAVVFKKGGGVASLVAELEAFLPSRSGPSRSGPRKD